MMKEQLRLILENPLCVVGTVQDKHGQLGKSLVRKLVLTTDRTPCRATVNTNAILQVTGGMVKTTQCWEMTQIPGPAFYQVITEWLRNSIKQPLTLCRASDDVVIDATQNWND